MMRQSWILQTTNLPYSPRKVWDTQQAIPACWDLLLLMHELPLETTAASHVFALAVGDYLGRLFFVAGLLIGGLLGLHDLPEPNIT